MEPLRTIKMKTNWELFVSTLFFDHFLINRYMFRYSCLESFMLVNLEPNWKLLRNEMFNFACWCNFFFQQHKSFLHDYLFMYLIQTCWHISMHFQVPIFAELTRSGRAPEKLLTVYYTFLSLGVLAILRGLLPNPSTTKFSSATIGKITASGSKKRVWTLTCYPSNQKFIIIIFSKEKCF